LKIGGFHEKKLFPRWNTGKRKPEFDGSAPRIAQHKGEVWMRTKAYAFALMVTLSVICVFADGLLLATDGNTKLYLIDPDPSGFKPLVNAELLESGNNWAPLALVDGKLLIRDQKQMKYVVVAQQSK
jgi:hypothetical protein